MFHLTQRALLFQLYYLFILDLTRKHTLIHTIHSLFLSHTHTHIQLVEKGRKIIIEQMVTTLATVADAAEELFVRYYSLFMPNLKHLMSNAINKEHRLLRGKTIECISFIGLAVGKEMVGVVRVWPSDGRVSFV